MRENEPELTLAPATRLLWRAPDEVHLELGRRAVVVEGLPVPLVRRIAARVPVGAAAPVAEQYRHVLDRLAEAGYLWPRCPDTGCADRLRTDVTDDDPRVAPPAPRLSAELTALTAEHGQDAAQVLNARRHASVQVCGSGRVAAPLAALLAAAGVGRVQCSAAGAARLQHAAPGGILPGDEGREYSAAAEAAVLRAAPGTDTAAGSADERPDLTILAHDTPTTDERRQALHADSAAHLAVHLGVDSGVVGPLVLPGFTSCLRCADLHRRDRDPAWPALSVQLRIGTRYGAASAVAVASVVAGVAAAQALAFLDGGEPAVIDATVELHPPDWRLRRRTWPPHPECNCMAD